MYQYIKNSAFKRCGQSDHRSAFSVKSRQKKNSEKTERCCDGLCWSINIHYRHLRDSSIVKHFCIVLFYIYVIYIFSNKKD